MRLSTKSTYGLRAMLDIALEPKRATPIGEIARREGISVDYLEQLLNRLRHAHLVNSVRGPKGGYVLARRPEKITVGDVVKTLEEDIAPVHCVTAKRNSKNGCKMSRRCVTKGVWERLAESINKCLDSMTLKDLCGDARKAGKLL